MAKEKKVLTQADFELVQSNVKIHDKAFDTKPTTFFKDALKRFCKNKSSIVAFGIIAILVLLAIFLPMLSNKNVDYIEKREAFLEPKLFDAGFGFIIDSAYNVESALIIDDSKDYKYIYSRAFDKKQR